MSHSLVSERGVSYTNDLYNLIRLVWLGMEVLCVRELMAYYSIGEVAERCAACLAAPLWIVEAAAK